MASEIDFEATEQDFRRRWHRAHIDRFYAEVGADTPSWRSGRLDPHADGARELLDALARTRDLQAFQQGTDRWTRGFDSGFSGFAGQMTLNQLVNQSPDEDVAVTVLLDALSVPGDLSDARRKIQLLADHMVAVGRQGQPGPARAPFVASYFWGLIDQRAWPVAWPKSMKYLAFVTGEAAPTDQGARYDRLYRFVMEVDGDPVRFEQVAGWWHDDQPVVLDPVLCDRAAFREEAPDPDTDAEKYLPNAKALVAVSDHIGRALRETVSEAAHLPLEARKPAVYWNKTRPRGDMWVDWGVKGRYGLGVRLWLNSRGMAVGLRPFPDAGAGATERAVEYLEQHPVPGYRIMSGKRSRTGEDVGFVGGGTGEVIYGRWYDREQFHALDVPALITTSAREVAPAITGMLTARGTVDDTDPVDPLDVLADELLVDRAFIDDIVALLKRKGQVVFYGPPGTGKTYFARKLAAALTTREERRPIVQFHPSTSYEDFFEGYRPETDEAGSMIYRLQKGPLAELADRATDAPDRRHVMVIDEINRANLPKVLGELLFLLEYRDTAVRTLYRPEEPFKLPGNIWFIGTMNTADRSIALIDAAMRRRFHFVPFFPEHGAMKDLLDRWLARNGEPAWIGRLVSQVNAELAEALGGPDLQLGASHFMQTGLDVAALERIWRYDIEPFIEDQFFGDADRIEFFRFPQVHRRFTAASAPVTDDIDDDAH